MQEWEKELYYGVEMLKLRLNLLKESGMTYILKTDCNGHNQIHPKESARMLEDLRQEIGDCRRCKLCQNRMNIVFGAGNPNSSLVFVGEGPGAEEDKQGLPFVGKAGQLLTKMINAMGYKREDVYICNVVKCRPEGNRDPEPGEIAECEPFLKGQLAIIKPKVIVGLGRYACQALLKTTTPMSKLRGTWHDYEGIKVMPTFHPAYLLRNPPAKKEVWQDLQMVMKALTSPFPCDNFAGKG
jgi:uracil-DNA glycosylase family 4